MVEAKQPGSHACGFRGLAGAPVLALPRTRAMRAPSFASLALLARAGIPGAGGISAECLVGFKRLFSNSRARFTVRIFQIE